MLINHWWNGVVFWGWYFPPLPLYPLWTNCGILFEKKTHPCVHLLNVESLSLWLFTISCLLVSVCLCVRLSVCLMVRFGRGCGEGGGCQLNMLYPPDMCCICIPLHYFPILNPKYISTQSLWFFWLVWEILFNLL